MIGTENGGRSEQPPDLAQSPKGVSPTVLNLLSRVGAEGTLIQDTPPLAHPYIPGESALDAPQLRRIGWRQALCVKSSRVRFCQSSLKRLKIA
jgi:hypothetical protein